MFWGNCLNNVQFYSWMPAWSYIVVDFTKQCNAYLWLVSPWKRVYCCHNNILLSVGDSTGVILSVMVSTICTLSVKTSLLLLQQCFNVGDSTKLRHAYLRLESPWKRVYCSHNNTQRGRFHRCYAQCHVFNYLYPRIINVSTLKGLLKSKAHIYVVTWRLKAGILEWEAKQRILTTRFRDKAYAHNSRSVSKLHKSYQYRL
jgi:hypothetical protein